MTSRRIAGCALALVLGFLAYPSPAEATTYLGDWQGGKNQRQDGYIDFDGNGRSDVFRTDGVSWYVSYDGRSNWTKLRSSIYRLENGLSFGDFDGDGKTDVFLSWNSNWLVSYGGTSAWTTINTSGEHNLAFGDFNGDNKTDVFRASGTAWYVSYGGTSAWTKINTSSATVFNLAFGDFNGDNKTDVFKADGTHWYVSSGGTGSWTQINDSAGTLSDLGFGDFNGDGRTDVFKATGTYWVVSYDGKSVWKPFHDPVHWNEDPTELHFADFDGDRRADVFREDGAGSLFIMFNDGGGFTGTSVSVSASSPVISTVQAGAVTPTGATITWTTDEPANSQVEYGPTANYGFSTVMDSTWRQVHSQTLSGLTPNTVYHYRVVSLGEGLQAPWTASMSADHTFTTPPADDVPPVITAVAVQSLTPTCAYITWTTNEPATSQVEYGQTTNYGQHTNLNPDLLGEHRESLCILGFSELLPNTLYHYRVKSRDAAGNTAVSGGYTFTTPPLPSNTTTTTTTTPTTTTTTTPTTTTTLPPTTTTTNPPPSTTTTTTPPPRPFTDVPQGHPYADQINDMAARNVVDGYGGGLFGPEDRVKRQQFAKMVVLAMGYPVSEADVCPFGDVDVGGASAFYPDNYVAVAAAQGITLGVSPGQFAPWNDITRAQLITMVARAGGVAEPPAGYSPPFGNFSATHYPWARRAAYAGLLNGLQGMGPGYDFWAPATRGEVCAVLYNLVH